MEYESSGENTTTNLSDLSVDKRRSTTTITTTVPWVVGAACRAQAQDSTQILPGVIKKVVKHGTDVVEIVVEFPCHPDVPPVSCSADEILPPIMMAAPPISRLLHNFAPASSTPAPSPSFLGKAQTEVKTVDRGKGHTSCYRSEPITTRLKWKKQPVNVPAMGPPGPDFHARMEAEEEDSFCGILTDDVAKAIMAGPAQRGKRLGNPKSKARQTQHTDEELTFETPEEAAERLLVAQIRAACDAVPVLDRADTPTPTPPPLRSGRRRRAVKRHAEVDFVVEEQRQQQQAGVSMDMSEDAATATLASAEAAAGMANTSAPLSKRLNPYSGKAAYLAAAAAAQKAGTLRNHGRRGGDHMAAVAATAGHEGQDVRPVLGVPASEPDAGPLVLRGGENAADLGGRPAFVCKRINQYLRKYQREGIQFMWDAYAGNRGCLLADDMGLGKTVQVIGLLAAIFGLNGEREHDCPLELERDWKTRHWPGTALIVVPANVNENWLQELNTWTHLRVEKFKTATADETIARVRSARVDVVLANYDTFSNHRRRFCETHWCLVVCDEAHRLKNAQSQRTQALKGLDSRTCARRVALTGTALQNEYLEFWCLLDWCCPGSFGTAKEFKRQVSEPIIKGSRREADEVSVGEKGRVMDDFAAKLKPMFLRRTKAFIRDELPEKRDNVVFCKPSALQKAAYLSLLNCTDTQYITLRNMECECGSGAKRKECCYKFVRGEHRSGPCTCPKRRITRRHAAEAKATVTATVAREDEAEAEAYHQHDEDCKACICTPDQLADPEYGCKPWNHKMLSQLHVLQDISNHIGLLLPRANDDEEQKRRKERIGEKVFPRGSEQHAWYQRAKRHQLLPLTEPEVSGKMDILMLLFKVWKAEAETQGDRGPKVLIFSYSLRLLDLIQMAFEAEGVHFYRIDGKVAPDKRQEMVHRFNKDATELFLISTRAGGEGINLTGANKVVIFDPNWNPSHDLQAQDRAYRIGQKRDVDVYRLISSGTLEELVYARQVYKQQASQQAQHNSRQTRYFGGTKDDPEFSEIFGLDNLFAKTFEANLFHKIVRAGLAATLIMGEQMGLPYDLGTYELEAAAADDVVGGGDGAAAAAAAAQAGGNMAGGGNHHHQQHQQPLDYVADELLAEEEGEDSSGAVTASTRRRRRNALAASARRGLTVAEVLGDRLVHHKINNAAVLEENKTEALLSAQAQDQYDHSGRAFRRSVLQQQRISSSGGGGRRRTTNTTNTAPAPAPASASSSSSPLVTVTAGATTTTTTVLTPGLEGGGNRQQQQSVDEVQEEQQFIAMAEYFEHPPLEFAQMVVTLPPTQRQNLIDRFYARLPQRLVASTS